MIPPSSQNTVDVCSHITLLILYDISSRLVTLPKVIDVAIQASDILVRTVCFKLINFNLQGERNTRCRLYETAYSVPTFVATLST